MADSARNYLLAVPAGVGAGAWLDMDNLPVGGIPAGQKLGRSLQLVVTGTYQGAVVFESSPDQVNIQALPAGAISSGAGNSVMVTGPVARYLRVRRTGANLDGAPAPLCSVVVDLEALGSVPANGSVDTPQLHDNAVTSAKIADGAVTSAKIADGTIATGDLADGAVTSAKIADGTIATGDLAASAVTGPKLAVGAILPILNVPGSNGAGACAAVGAKVGDKVLMMSFAKTPTLAAGGQAGLTAFETTITVVNQIQQTGAADLSAEAFDLLLLVRS